MSSDDADDERESPLPPPTVQWIDPKSLRFTVFVVLPSEEVCTLRDLPSGITVFDLKGRLEIYAGTPSQVYYLCYPDGEVLEDDQKLLVQENILDGYLLKMHLHDTWESLYVSITKNNIEHLYHSGGVHMKGNIVIRSDEADRYEAVVRERSTVALYMACFLGLQRMVRMLLSVGVNVNSTTTFGRTAVHATVSKDNVAILDMLINNGASIKHIDFFGMTALDVAKAISSSVCAKKLRLMHLNLRGNANHVTQNSLIGQSRYNSTNRKPNVTRVDHGRTRSTLSQYSDHSEFSKSKSDTPLHTSRKHISASAPIADTTKMLPLRDNGEAQDNMKALQPKRVVKWKDIPSENVYWQVNELPNTTNGSIGLHDAVCIKPVALIQQKKVLKFAGVSYPEPEPEVPTCSPRNGLEHNSKQKLTEEKTNQAMKFTKARMRYFRKLAKSADNNKTMRRRINIAANHGRQGTDTSHTSEAFRLWLAKKNEEFENAEDSEISSGDCHESDTDTDKMMDFNKKIRKRNRSAQSRTPGNRPLLDIISIGSTTLGDPSNPPAELNITAHNTWRKNRHIYERHIPSRRRTVVDFNAERKKLEEKRQQLLMNAISYDEWIDHAEDKKELIKQILKADLKEMTKLEEDRFKDRFRLHSFDGWLEKSKKRDIEEKTRREIQKKQEAMESNEKCNFSSTAVSFDTWAEQKVVQKKAEKDQQKKQVSLINNSKPRDSATVESAYQKWAMRKHQEEIGNIEAQIRKEREMLTTMRQLRTSAVS